MNNFVTKSRKLHSMKVSWFLLILICLLPYLSNAQETVLSRFLQSIPGAEVKKVDSSSFIEFYILMLPQLVNHNNPGGDKFRQRIYVGHRGYDRPTVMESEGYGAEWMNGYIMDEPTRILNANQLYIEHRYFGKSAPESPDWKYLTAEQDAADYHYIRQLFGQVYKGKWVATGVSKGGQTTTEYKIYFPDDVDVSIPYVAPINYKLLDKRIDRHFKHVGTSECRKRIREIQDQLLKNKKSNLPVYEQLCKKAGFTFKIMDPETAFDYSVLEFPFSFWQYTADCNVLPEVNAGNDKLVQFLIQIVSPYWYTESMEAFAPANYQFYNQLGYYEYDERPFRNYLKNKDYPNSCFGPKGVEVKWDNSYIKKLKKFIRNKPQHMIFIYGESDPWGATGAKIKRGSGSLKEVMAHGTHGANIGSMSKAQQQEIYGALEQWLGITLKQPVSSNPKIPQP